jgi:hypothetical protein
MTRREFGLWASAAAIRTQTSAAATPRRRTLLLVDEHHILYRAGTHRKLCPLRKYAQNPVLAGRVKP